MLVACHARSRVFRSSALHLCWTGPEVASIDYNEVIGWKKVTSGLHYQVGSLISLFYRNQPFQMLQQEHQFRSRIHLEAERACHRRNS